MVCLTATLSAHQQLQVPNFTRLYQQTILLTPVHTPFSQKLVVCTYYASSDRTNAPNNMLTPVVGTQAPTSIYTSKLTAMQMLRVNPKPTIDQCVLVQVSSYTCMVSVHYIGKHNYNSTEYYSSGLYSRVMIGFRQLCATLGFLQSFNEIRSDNQSALYLLKTRLSHSKSRHIKIQFIVLEILSKIMKYTLSTVLPLIWQLISSPRPSLVAQFQKQVVILYDEL